MPTEPSANADPAETTHKVVVGVDGSDNAMRALDWAAAQADHTGAVLEIQTAYEPGYVFVTQDEIKRSMEQTVGRAVARVAELAPRVVTRSATHEQSPAKALIEASEGADLLVVGSRGLSGFAGLVLGSVSQKCCLHARCSLAIIR
jgi:nucleotide-binding universal stress UspA family protein